MQQNTKRSILRRAGSSLGRQMHTYVLAELASRARDDPAISRYVTDANGSDEVDHLRATSLTSTSSLAPSSGTRMTAAIHPVWSGSRDGL